MISILIPVFNRDVIELVNVLGKQLKLLNNSGEIIVMDDGSEAYFKNLNSTLAGVEFVQYVELKFNYGRMRIREILVTKAAYEWLLFVDCDSTIISDRFLATYSNHLTNITQVMVGGRMYAPQEPTDCRCMLHWKYGTGREVTQFDNQNHINRFMTNNFLIRKNVFKKFNFTGGWDGYGYEDTWMGIQLEAMNVPVQFINNPVMHDGVESSTVFIRKSEEALNNLRKLSEAVASVILIRHVRLYNYFYLLRSWKLLWLVRLVCFVLKGTIHKNMHSCKPSLLLFDLYRLNYFITTCEV